MNLIEGIQKEQKRVREELIPEYEAIGSAGALGVSMMIVSIANADRAIAAGDTVAMITAYKGLKGYTA